jgi:hypothetical protein
MAFKRKKNDKFYMHIVEVLVAHSWQVIIHGYALIDAINSRYSYVINLGALWK